jgi:nucleoside-diphosphate-sugar epimerase
MADGERGRVLVTGLGGFTGRHLRRELAEAGHEVVGLGLELDDAPGQRRVDLADAAAVRAAVAELAPDRVLHLAAVSFVAHERLDELYAANVLGSLHLLEALAALPRPPRRVVLASSATVYGDAPAGERGLDEDTPPAPVNHYAATKLAMEATARVYRAALPITVVRPFNYTGPGQAPRFLVPKLVAHAAARAPRIALGNLDVERDFLDVRVVCAAYRRLLTLDAPSGTVVNLCSGVARSLRGILAELEALTGHRLEVEVDPALVRGHELRRLAGDPSRLRALVGPLPELPFTQTLRDMLAAAGDPSGGPS